jgi:hypothetical protein
MASNLERAQNLADAGQYQQSIARSLIVIAAALTIQAEGGRRETSTNKVLRHHEWCDDPTCPNPRHEIEVDQIG